VKKEMRNKKILGWGIDNLLCTDIVSVAETLKERKLS